MEIDWMNDHDINDGTPREPFPFHEDPVRDEGMRRAECEPLRG